MCNYSATPRVKFESIFLTILLCLHHAFADDSLIPDNIAEEARDTQVNVVAWSRAPTSNVTIVTPDANAPSNVTLSGVPPPELDPVRVEADTTGHRRANRKPAEPDTAESKARPEVQESKSAVRRRKLDESRDAEKSSNRKEPENGQSNGHQKPKAGESGANSEVAESARKESSDTPTKVTTSDAKTGSSGSRKPVESGDQVEGSETQKWTRRRKPETEDPAGPEVPKDESEPLVRGFKSEHEEPAEVPTRVVFNGSLATPAPGSGIKLDFVPRQSYVQVRRTDSVKRLPQSEAYAAAKTKEERENAGRLREVVSHKKSQEDFPRETTSQQEPKSRKGQYKRRKKDSPPIDFLLEQLTSSGSSDPPSPAHHSTPRKCSVEPSNRDRSGDGSETPDSNLSGTGCEESTSGNTLQCTINTSGNFSFFEEEGNEENEDERSMALEESFHGYEIIDPSPNENGVFEFLQGEDFDINTFDNPPQKYLHSSDEEDVPEIELDELLQYCQSEAATESMGEDLLGVRKFLREWSVENSTSLLSLSRLLKGLKETHPKCFSELPVDGRTVMGTNVDKLDVRKVPPGEYVHLGVRKQLDFIASFIQERVEHFGLLINIDGVKLYKNSKSSLYPILMTVPTCVSLKNKVFPVGLYYGKGRPADMRLFLDQFIEEMLTLLTSNDFFIKGESVKILLLGFCCDTPARSEILETVGHSGYFSCFRCVTKGENITTEGSTGGKKKKKRSKGGKQRTGSKRIFPELNAAPREDIKFRNKLYPQHQPAKRDLTPLVDLPGLDFPRSFVLDPMHLVFLGITRAILSLLFLGGPYLLKPSLRQRVQNKLEDCLPFLPSDFARKPTEIRSVGTSKAAECRLYLLYLVFVILKNSLDRERYVHLMRLAIAMRIYHHSGLCGNDEARALAKEYIEIFVSSVPELYGKMNMSHNMHSLKHVPDDIEWFKDSIPEFTANDISAFPPENFNQVFRRFTRGYNRALAQNCRRLGELFQSDFWRQKYVKGMPSSSEEIRFQLPHNNGPLPLFVKGGQFKEAVFPRFTLSVHQADCTCGTVTGDVVVAANFIEEKPSGTKYVVGKKYELKSEFFSEPLVSSKKLGIFKVAKLSNFNEKWPVSSINAKFVRLPYVKDETIPIAYSKQEYVVLPLLHSEAGPSTS